MPYPNIYFKLLPETNQMICSLEQKAKMKIRDNMRQYAGRYTLRKIPSIHFPSEFILFKKHRRKKVTFADKFTVAGTGGEIKANWDILQ